MPGEIFENMLQMMSFSVNYERFLNTNNGYFHIDIISAAHICYWVPGENFEIMVQFGAL